MQPIEWKEPWRAIQFAAEIPWVQKQFEQEITSKHPLHGKGGTVIGRRIDCDDVLVVLNDGAFVNVHLVWGSGPGAFPDKWPSWFSYGSQESFVQAMQQDALEYGDET
ncbi:hypothetical protein [Aquipseudomonas alcaligenes]|uniref:Uncharacterized protein n=1 Tax=Aquipseudomonas alcaligenes TaxID=43263 RepID=A0AA37FNL6_AQUAC|nr:hypothetical protein [Pseudomonas alcaligenes]BCR23990.1 hypothetical protein KAM426_15170 [Pseudomonas alcaligenes]GIZ69202.1 hypothetical protein KAM428_42870 [Pseudomonas alcaligenes]GIZ73375.1 hypothetical protein KAM429_41360 [Pseudomonas alcaligenes]GIZ77765.1 hypothetical protein KAM430_41740 [Pseudomonas alcaligenes]GIZ86449.1 hypothetical protein KAM434_41440 [Pseudomonas alcaligenes]